MKNPFKLNTSNVNPQAVVYKKALEDWNKLPLMTRVRIKISNRIWFAWRNLIAKVNPKNYGGRNEK